MWCVYDLQEPFSSHTLYAYSWLAFPHFSWKSLLASIWASAGWVSSRYVPSSKVSKAKVASLWVTWLIFFACRSGICGSSNGLLAQCLLYCGTCLGDVLCVLRLLRYPPLEGVWQRLEHCHVPVRVWSGSPRQGVQSHPRLQAWQVLLQLFVIHQPGARILGVSITSCACLHFVLTSSVSLKQEKHITKIIRSGRHHGDKMATRADAVHLLGSLLLLHLEGGQMDWQGKYSINKSISSIDWLTFDWFVL